MNNRKIKNTISTGLFLFVSMTLTLNATAVLSEIKAIPNPTTDTTPNYEFNSTEAGKISLDGSCGLATPTEATVGKNTITFATLTVNTYEGCTLTVTGAEDNTSSTLLISAFTILESKKENNTTKDTTPPVITLNGDEKIFLPRGQTYIENGATATDNVDGNITSEIAINGEVYNNKNGTYHIAYTVSDTAGNLARKDREVKVAVIVDGVDTDSEGIPDIQDYDDDNDGAMDEHDAFPLDPKETTDLDGDGIGDNADTDDDGNGIEDAQEQTWISYKNNLAIIARSRLEAQGLQVIPLVSGDVFSLVHNFGTKQNAYVASNKSGEVFSGFKTGTTKDSTLKEGTFFKAGTTSVIKMDTEPVQVIIQIRAKFNKNDTFVIGGK